MKQELTQMAFNFPTEAEPQAAPHNAISPGETAAREEARRAGLGLRIKSMKNGAAPSSIKVEPVAVPAPTPAPAPKIVRPEPTPGAETLPAAVVKTEPVVYIGPTLFPLPPASEAPVVQSTAEDLLPAPEPEPLITAQPRPEPMPEPPPLPRPDPEIIPEPRPVTEPSPQPRPGATPTIGTTVQESGPTGPTTAVQQPAAAAAQELGPVTPAAAVIQQPAAEPEAEPFVAPTREYKKASTAAAEKPKSKRGRKSLKQITAEADLIEIPADEVLFSKQYYTMGEVAEMFRVNQSLLRFWETEFSILQPRKNKKGDRHFRPVDIKNLHLIYHLLRQRKYTIEGAKEFLKTNKKPDQRFEAIQRLQQIRAFLLELKAQL